MPQASTGVTARLPLFHLRTAGQVAATANTSGYDPKRWFIMGLLSLGVVIAFISRTNLSSALAYKPFVKLFHRADRTAGPPVVQVQLQPSNIDAHATLRIASPHTAWPKDRITPRELPNHIDVVPAPTSPQTSMLFIYALLRNIYFSARRNAIVLIHGPNSLENWTFGGHPAARRTFKTAAKLRR